MINLNEVILFVCLSVVGSSVIVQLVKQKAWLLGLIDVPTGRSLHTEPKPRGGGLGICSVTLVGGAFALILVSSPGLSLSALIYFYIGAILLAFIGLLDDKQSVSRWTRLCVHIFAALVAILGFGYWTSITVPIYGELSLSWFGILFTALWFVGLINAFNFMDGIDGIAAGQTIVSGMGWFVIAATVNEPWVALLAAILMGSSAGFIVHNWSPSTVFMGDVGSTFIGYTLAIIPLMMSHSGRLSGSIAPAIALFLVWPFVFDSFFTFIRRLLKHENVFKPHRSHMYQDLVLSGYNHSTISVIYIILASSGLPMAWIWLKGSDWSRLIVVAALCGLCLACVCIWITLRKASKHIVKQVGLAEPQMTSAFLDEQNRHRLVRSKSRSYTPLFLGDYTGKHVSDSEKSTHLEDKP